MGVLLCICICNHRQFNGQSCQYYQKMSIRYEAAHYPTFSIPTCAFLYSSYSVISWYMSIQFTSFCLNWMHKLIPIFQFAQIFTYMTFFLLQTNFSQWLLFLNLLACADQHVLKQHSTSACSHILLGSPVSLVLLILHQYSHKEFL